MIGLLSEKETNKKLIEEYPFLLPRNRFTDEVCKDYDYSYTEFDDECPDGWAELKLDFYKKLKPLLIKADYLDKFRIVQSKEKYGYWHLYTNGIPKSIVKEYYDLFHKYEELSEHTCVFCGKEAKMCDFGWISPICKECWDKGYISDTRNYDEVVIKENDNAN